MKKFSISMFILILVSIIFLPLSFLFGQSVIRNAELLIINKMPSVPSFDTIIVKIYPVGTFFRPANIDNSFMQYVPLVSQRNTRTNNRYITGGEKKIIPFRDLVPVEDQTNAFYRINHDGTEGEGNYVEITVGYGKYQVDLLANPFGEGYEIFDTFTVDWSDFEYPYHIPGYSFSADIQVLIYDLDDIRVHFGGSGNIGNDYFDLDYYNHELRIWYQSHNPSPVLSKRPNKNNFMTTNEDNGLYLDNWPILGTDFVDPSSPEIHITPGLLNVYLEIQNNHHAKINEAVPFIVNDSAMIILKKSSVLDSNARLYVQDGGELRFKNAAALKIKDFGSVVVESGGKLVMENHSKLIFYPNSELRFKQGALFCNEGTGIKGNGSIIYEKGYHQYNCAELADFLFQDSIKIILEDSAVVEIPDSTIFHLSGINSTLILNPYSKIKLGVNSKLLLDSSATLIAKGATFTSLDTSDKWEGIVLQNSGEDTIMNCTFSNAKNSLAFLNSPGHTFTTRVVKNNVFNIPSGSDNIGIYGENNFRITIQDNTFNMPDNPDDRHKSLKLKKL